MFHFGSLWNAFPFSFLRNDYSNIFWHYFYNWISKSCRTKSRWHKIPPAKSHIPPNPISSKSYIPHNPGGSQLCIPQNACHRPKIHFPQNPGGYFVQRDFFALWDFVQLNFASAGILRTGILCLPGFCTTGFCVLLVFVRRDFTYRILRLSLFVPFQFKYIHTKIVAQRE